MSQTDKTVSDEDQFLRDFVDNLSITLVKPIHDGEDSDAENSVVILGNVSKGAWVTRYYHPDKSGAYEFGIFELVRDLTELDSLRLSPDIKEIRIREPASIGGRTYVVERTHGLWSVRSVQDDASKRA